MRRNKMTSELEKLEDQSFYEDDYSEIPPSDIVAYNELRSCADLNRMYVKGILEIHPEFQREEVWNKANQTRFIDSLIKQLPIPSMCFSLDYKTQKWQVIDGLQRMATITSFLSGDMEKLSRLDDVDPKISGQRVSKFIDENSDLYKYYVRIENLTLPITVLRCDYTKSAHSEYLFTIFHRLNTGGMKLNNQEIRNCIYSGSLNNLLHELDGYESWMKLNRMKKGQGSRFTKQELILRLFAFHEKYKTYGGRLAKFLNDYMKDNRKLGDEYLNKKRQLFTKTVDIVLKKIFMGKISRKLTITVLETVLIRSIVQLKLLGKSNR